MSGTTARHNQIVTNIYTRLRAAARGGPCRAYVIDLKVRAGHDRIYYPDGVVVCTPHAGDTLIFDDPCLIVEVTSRSTRRLDHGEKMDGYLGIPSLRGYLIAEHDRRRVTLHARAAAGEWQRTELLASGRLDLPCPASSLSLDEIYEGVELPPLRVSEEPDDDEDTWVDLGGLEIASPTV
jgi:Uma2 family endonuclease